MPPMSRCLLLAVDFFLLIPDHVLRCRGRDLLVDGGYTDNLPLLQMVRMAVFVLLFAICNCPLTDCLIGSLKTSPWHWLHYSERRGAARQQFVTRGAQSSSITRRLFVTFLRSDAPLYLLERLAFTLVTHAFIRHTLSVFIVAAFLQSLSVPQVQNQALGLLRPLSRALGHCQYLFWPVLRVVAHSCEGQHSDVHQPLAAAAVPAHRR
jgi:hypothetical protein